MDVGHVYVPRSPAEARALQEAFRAIQDSQRTNFERTFRGARFAIRADEAAKQSVDAVNDVTEVADSVMSDMVDLGGYQSFRTGFSTVANPSDFVMGVLKKLTGLESSGEVATAVGPSVMLNFYSAVAPFFGTIRSGAQSIQNFYKAIDDCRDSFRAQEAVIVVNTGAPQQAMTAISTLLDSRSNDSFAQGAIQLVEAAVGAALIATGVGAVATTATGIASKIATLSVTCRRRALEYKEVKRGQMALAAPGNLTPAVFTDCPLLGCYLLTNSTHSDIVMSCFSRGNVSSNWMSEVERNMRILHPLIDKAKSFINDYLWILRGGGITNRASVTDRRPWVERMWIGRYGASNSGYRTIKTVRTGVERATELQERITGVTDYVTDPIRTLLKKDIELFLEPTQSAATSL